MSQNNFTVDVYNSFLFHFHTWKRFEGFNSSGDTTLFKMWLVLKEVYTFFQQLANSEYSQGKINGRNASSSNPIHLNALGA